MGHPSHAATVGLVLSAAGLFTAAASGQRPATTPVMPGGRAALHHQIRTAAPEAQRLFDQGLTLYYGFNREGARRSFAAAAARDAAAAMPLVGTALSYGPNLNTDSTASEIAHGCTAARQGLERGRQADERAYADALIQRYCGGLSFDSATAYAIAMGELFQRSPDDPDAAVLYAESLLMLRPRTAEQNVELVGVLELVLKRWPDHVGANHLYIHAVEGSSTPQRALASARRIEAQAPAVGHLLHMPSHIYTRTGDYDRAIEANLRALAADRAYSEQNPGDVEQAMYLDHDLESLAVALSTAGRFERARQAVATSGPGHGHGAATAHNKGQVFSPITLSVLLRFFRWSDVVQMPAPPPGAPTLLLYHFGRAIAYSRLSEWPRAEAERRAFDREASKVPPTAMYRSNPMRAVLDVFRDVLDARFATRRGDTAVEIEAWRRAAVRQDQLTYHEPAPIYYPVRESLGAALFRAARYVEAERVFQDDLTWTPRNGRSLFGLWQTLVKMDRKTEADAAQRRFREAWAGSDVELSLAEY
jgi:tetratricopeptide (TPR) repeat protein